MTQKLYHDDSYLKVFSAEVLSHDPESHGFILSQTAFYPGGGGQPVDQGTLTYNQTSTPLENLKQSTGQIIHIFPASVPLPEIGSAVTGKLNWGRRYKLMRTHTAMHILCGVIFRDYRAMVTGGNMEPLQGRMDFEFSDLHKDLVLIIEDAVNQEIANSLPVTWKNIPRDEAFQIPDLIRTKINLLPQHINEIRIVEISGLDLQADGGTHVKNTSEVGKIKITDYKSKGKENKRIYIEIMD